jgi:TPR repeat protein
MNVQAVSWYRKAADAGETRSMSWLGVMYSTGVGVLQKDDAQAVTVRVNKNETHDVKV